MCNTFNNILIEIPHMNSRQSPYPGPELFDFLQSLLCKLFRFLEEDTFKEALML